MYDPILQVTGLHAGYGDTQVLFGVEFTLKRGEIATLLGRNGAGKTTVLRALMGLVAVDSGAIHLNGHNIAGAKPETIARAGLAFCPEDRGIYARLTVEENLEIAVQTGENPLTTGQIFDMFPNLNARRTSYGNQLSGGEQQMLAIGRTLRTGAPVLLLDEPTEGLAPAIVQEIGRLLQQARERGLSVLLVEQNFRFAARLADQHFVMNKGMVIKPLTAPQLAQNETRVRALLGL